MFDGGALGAVGIADYGREIGVTNGFGAYRDLFAMKLEDYAGVGFGRKQADARRSTGMQTTTREVYTVGYSRLKLNLHPAVRKPIERNARPLPQLIPTAQNHKFPVVAWVWGRYPLIPEPQVTLSYALLLILAGFAAIFRHDFKGLKARLFRDFSTGVHFASMPKN